MSQQSPLNSHPTSQSSRGAGTTLGPSSGDSQKGTSAGTVGSNSTSGHGQNPANDKDDSNATMPGSKVGVQNEDLDGEQMRAPGEGETFRQQLKKEGAGWGEQESLTSDLDRKKDEQKAAREDVKAQREAGVDVDGGSGGRLGSESNADA